MNHELTEITLDSGTKGLFIDVPGSKVLTMRLSFRAGFQFSDFNKYETAHLIEHHILNATKRHPKKNQIKAEIAANGAYSNALTYPSILVYVAEFAEFEAERILDLFGQIITEPLFPEDQYLTERENVRTELTGYLSNHARQLGTRMSSVDYPELVMPIETRLEQLDSITHEDVIGHYRATHSAQNANFVMAGAISENRAIIERALNHIFSSLPKGTRNEFWDGPGLGQKKPLLIAEKIDSLYFDIEWFSDGVNLAERAAGNLLRGIMVGGFGSRVFGKARDAGLTYHVGVNADWSTKGAAFAFGGFCNPDKWEPLLELIATEMNDVVEHGPTIEELEAAKKRSIGGITLGSQTAADVAGWYANDYFFDGSTLSYDEYFASIRAVTPKMVQAIARRLMHSTAHTIGVLGAVDQLDEAAIERILKPVWR